MVLVLSNLMAEHDRSLESGHPSKALAPLRIVQIHGADSGGGAEYVASMLHRQFLEQGHDAWLLVGSKRSDNNCERTISTPRTPLYRGELGLRAVLQKYLGLQGFASPTLSGENWPLPFSPDAILVHSIHGASNFFRTEDLIWLAKRARTFVYLHDQWYMTGHCAYSLGCERWKIGCGSCPDLSIYPALQRDGTARNWRRKRRLFSTAEIVVGSPARWTLDLARQSPVLSRSDQYWIPNGIDRHVFHENGRAESRQRLQISSDAKVVLFLAQQGSKSPFKDFETLAEAFRIIRQKGIPVQLVTVGGEPSAETRISLPDDVRYFPYTNDREEIADFYRAADIFCHSTKADVFPLTIIESLACGTPVVGTDVGGVRELVIPGRTGWLTPLGDARTLAQALLEALGDSENLKSLAEKAVVFASEFTIQRQAAQFIELFRRHVTEK